jgi:hypothetical protein
VQPKTLCFLKAKTLYTTFGASTESSFRTFSFGVGKIGDTKDGSWHDIGGISGGTPVVGQSSMDELIGALTMFMQQQRTSTSGQGATKALKGIIDKIGRFDGKDITRFLKVYICEMEVH